MTAPERFRAVALGLPGVRERQVMSSHQFGVGRQVFATLGWPGAGYAIVRLAPSEGRRFVGLSAAISLEPGLRGRRGIVRVRLEDLDPAVAPLLLLAAHRHATEAAAKPASAPSGERRHG